MQDDSRTRVVIVGRGLAGVACASLLGEDDRVDVTLIDQNGYHQFQPLLYQVATAELAGQDMTFEHTEIFRRQPSVKTVQGDVSSADEMHGQPALASWLGVHAELVANTHAEQPKIHWGQSSGHT